MNDNDYQWFKDRIRMVENEIETIKKKLLEYEKLGK
jgi:hypothetical protein